MKSIKKFFGIISIFEDFIISGFQSGEFDKLIVAFCMFSARVDIGVVSEQVEFEVILESMKWSSKVGGTADVEEKGWFISPQSTVDSRQLLIV